MTKSSRGHQSGSFDWRAWWDANRWRYLEIQSLSGGHTGDRNATTSGLLSDPERTSAIATLRELAAGSKRTLAREALGALASIGGGEASTDIAGAAACSDSDRRLAAFLAASRLASNAGIDEMRAALRDANRSPLERGAAAVVLGIRGDASSRGPLAALANDVGQPLDARVGAVIGLGVAGGDSAKVVGDLLGRDKEARVLKLAAAFALGRSGEPVAIQPLIDALRGGDSADLRRTAAASLGALAIHGKRVLASQGRSDASLTLLDAATSDTDLAVRGLALISLAQIGATGGHRECHRILASGSSELVAPALLALAIDGYSLDGDLILEFLEGNAAHRAPAALALGILRYDGARNKLRDLFESTSDRSVKQFTALALGFLRDALSVPPITRFIVEAGDRDSSESAAQALGLMGSYPALVGLRGTADSAPNSGVRALALEMLGRVRDVESQRRFEAVLESALRSEEEKAAAVRALGFLGSPAGYLPPIREIFTDRDWDVRGALSKTLVSSL